MPALARSSSLDLHDFHADVWHAHVLSQAPLPVLATGDPALDAQLPGGGWPVGALTEILQPPGVHSEWRLLLPALVQSGSGPVVLVGAPHLPFAPALAALGLMAQRLLWVSTAAPAARLWACEQALRCAEVNAVLAWLPQARSDQLRRLQMAAAEYSKLLFVMRPAAVQDEASPATLRLHIQPHSAKAGSAAEPPHQPSRQHASKNTSHHASQQASLQPVQLPTHQPSKVRPTPISDALQLQLLKRRGPSLEQPLHLQARGGRMNLLLAAAHALDRSSAHA